MYNFTKLLANLKLINGIHNEFLKCSVNLYQKLTVACTNKQFSKTDQNIPT